MNLIDKLKTPPGTTTMCGVAGWIESLPEEEQEAIQAALENPDWETRALHRLFAEHGLSRNETTLGKHRRGDCPCARN